MIERYRKTALSSTDRIGCILMAQPFFLTPTTGYPSSRSGHKIPSPASTRLPGTGVRSRARGSAKGAGRLRYDILYDIRSLIADALRYAPHLFRPAPSPIERFQLMYHGDAFRAASGGNAHFESVSLWLRSNGSDEHQAKRRVKGRWRKNERRAAFHLLSPHLRVEIQNDYIASLWNAHSTRSAPTARPAPTSSSGSRTVASRAARRALEGRSSKRASPTRRNSTRSPSRRPKSRAKTAGRRTVRLLP